MSIKEALDKALKEFDDDDSALESLEKKGYLIFDEEEPEDALDHLLPGEEGVTPKFEYLWSQEYGVLIMKERK